MTAAIERQSEESIRPGMSMQDTFRILGAPDKKYKTWPGRNVWVYRTGKWTKSDGGELVEVVIDDDGLVIEVRDEYHAPQRPDPYRPTGPIMFNGR